MRQFISTGEKLVVFNETGDKITIGKCDKCFTHYYVKNVRFVPVVAGDLDEGDPCECGRCHTPVTITTDEFIERAMGEY